MCKDHKKETKHHGVSEGRAGPRKGMVEEVAFEGGHGGLLGHGKPRRGSALSADHQVSVGDLGGSGQAA